MRNIFKIFNLKKQDKYINKTENLLENEKILFNKLDKNLLTALKDNGFIKIKLLENDTISKLKDLYYSQPNAKKNDFGFHVSSDIKQEGIIDLIANKITEIIQPFTDIFLNEYQFILPRFAVKEANHNSLVPPHQDWSLVDEAEYQSYNLWIALTPCTLENGTLGFLKGSQNKLNNIRATPLPIYKVPFHDYAYDLIEHLDYINLNPGEAFLFNSRIIHASKPNISNEPRINIVIEISNNTAPLIHYNIQSDNKTINEYFINQDFFCNYSNAKLTAMYYSKDKIINYKINRTFKYKNNYISKNELLS